MNSQGLFWLHLGKGTTLLFILYLIVLHGQNKMFFYYHIYLNDASLNFSQGLRDEPINGNSDKTTKRIIIQNIFFNFLH
jgi:hypothetical protein